MFISYRPLINILNNLFRSVHIWNKSLEMLSQEKSYKVTFTESTLNGTERFVADDIATKDDCKILMELANVSNVKPCLVKNHVK